jgi:hypothetical protein
VTEDESPGCDEAIDRQIRTSLGEPESRNGKAGKGISPNVTLRVVRSDSTGDGE